MPEPRVDPGPDVQSLARDDARYPARLLQIHDPPARLYYRGGVPDWGQVVAIVGTRRCSSYGRRLACDLAAELARSGVLVLSGLAWGIDAAAHGGALASTGRTAAVVARGPELCYPRTNLPIYRQMLEREQCVLSEYPPGTPPDKWRFRARNRLIAAIAHAVVVVEAPVDSGALITARFAADHTSTEVMVVPGPADAPSFAGGHALLRDGARLVTCAAEILEDLGWQHTIGRANEPAPGLAPDTARVLRAIGSEGASADDLADRLELPGAAVLLALTTLELQGRVSTRSGGVFFRC